MNWKGKHGPLLLAEIGGNHEGDFEYAKRLTQLAIESDVDYVKFQMYSGDTLVSRLENPARNQHFKKFELLRDQYTELAQMCQAAGVGFMASVWDVEYLEWIDEYIPIYKIGSGDLTAYPVLKATAKKKKPIILSTGLSTLEEVVSAVEYIQSIDPLYEDPNYLSVLQCTSMYPIPFEDANLAVMQTIHSITGLPVGYSDHTEGSKALEIAVALGAQILEFHFTDTRDGKVFRDHKVSLTRDEVHQLIKGIKNIQALKGHALKRPLPVEGDHPITFRRAVYPKIDIPVGTIIEERHLTTLRPKHGIDARDFEKLIGKKTNKDLKTHERLEWEYFD